MIITNHCRRVDKELRIKIYYWAKRLAAEECIIHTRRLNYHRSCEVYLNDDRIAIGKTKKEIKDLINGGYINGK